MEIKIAHMYPELLNLYGDKGNINALCKRLTWRGIDASVKRFELHDDLNLEDIDILFIGGGSDREQKIVCERLLKEKENIKQYVENDGVTVAVCGGYQLLGKYIKLDTETIDGLGFYEKIMVQTTGISNHIFLIQYLSKTCTRTTTLVVLAYYSPNKTKSLSYILDNS